MLIPYIISNVAALAILWFSVKKPSVAKVMLAVLFVGAGAANVYISFTNPAAYRTFAETSVLDWYAVVINGFFSDYTTLIVSCISIVQVYVGVSMFLDGTRFSAGCVAGLLFGLMIAPLGIGSAFPSSVIFSLAFFVLLIGRDKHAVAA